MDKTEQIAGELRNLNLLFEQTEAYVRQHLKEKLQDRKFQCFERNSDGESYASCVQSFVKLLETQGREMKFRLTFFESKMEACYRAQAGDNADEARACQGRLQALSDLIVTEVSRQDK